MFTILKRGQRRASLIHQRLGKNKGLSHHQMHVGRLVDKRGKSLKQAADMIQCPGGEETAAMLYDRLNVNLETNGFQRDPETDPPMSGGVVLWSSSRKKRPPKRARLGKDKS